MRLSRINYYQSNSHSNCGKTNLIWKQKSLAAFNLSATMVHRKEDAPHVQLHHVQKPIVARCPRLCRLRVGRRFQPVRTCGRRRGPRGHALCVSASCVHMVWRSDGRLHWVGSRASNQQANSGMDGENRWLVFTITTCNYLGLRFSDLLRLGSRFPGIVLQ